MFKRWKSLSFCNPIDKDFINLSLFTEACIFSKPIYVAMLKPKIQHLKITKKIFFIIELKLLIYE